MDLTSCQPAQGHLRTERERERETRGRGGGRRLNSEIMKENTPSSIVPSHNSSIDRILIDVCLESEIISRALFVSSFCLGGVLNYTCSEVLLYALGHCARHVTPRYDNKQGT